MTDSSFDVLTRSLGRRRAVQALTAAAATTLSGVTLGAAKSNNGKKKKHKKQAQKIKQKAIALCVDQVGQCETLVGDNPAGIACCQILGDCDFTGFIACLRAA